MNQDVIDILKVYLANNPMPPERLVQLLGELGILKVEGPKIDIEATVTDDYIICLEDGRKMKILKRHLQQTYNMTPEEYRRKWNLPDDYPMVAKNYGLARSAIAKEQGLGKRAA